MPGWFIVAIDTAQRMTFLTWVGRQMPALENFVTTWGWIIGPAWLAAIFFVAPMNQSKEAHHARNAERLSRQLADTIRSIEHLCMLYEMDNFTVTTHRLALEDRRRTLLTYAIADLLEYVTDSIPHEFQPYYRLHSVAGAIVDLMRTPRDNLSSLAHNVTVTSGLDLYLERRRQRAEAPAGRTQQSARA